MFRKTDRQRGVAIVLVMFMLFLIIGFTMATGLYTQQNFSNSSGRERTQEALYAFQSGLSTAMAELTADPTWAPTEASPYVKYLDSSKHVGFRVWLEGINLASDVPVMTTSGHALGKGQAAIKVVAMVNGQDIHGGFGGAEATPILVRPEVKFSNSILQPDPSLTLKLPASGGYVSSYNSDTGVLPASGFPTPPPLTNQQGAIHALGDVSVAGTQVFGTVILPPSAKLSVGTGSYLSETRLDQSQPPLKFAVPQGALGALALPPTSGPIPPGFYGELSVTASETITLQRGGEYFLSYVYMEDGSNLELTGPLSDGPCVVYIHDLFTGANSRINMPSAGIAPRPSDLQFYGVPYEGCDGPYVRFRSGTEACFVYAAHDAETQMDNGTNFYGAMIVANVRLQNNVQLYFDQALLGETFEGLSEWVLVSQGMN